MIANFSDPATEDVFNGIDSRRARQRCGRMWRPMAIRKLTQLNRIRCLEELRFPSRNWVVLHPERGAGCARIRVSGLQWIHFRWEDGRAQDVAMGGVSPSTPPGGRASMPITARSGRYSDTHDGDPPSEENGYPPMRRPLPTHRPPLHPGEMLRVEFIKPRGLTQGSFAVQLGISFARLNEVVNAKRAVTPDTALRLARVTGMSADFWLGLQMDWDLWHALRSDVAKEIANLEPLPPRGDVSTASPASSPCSPR